MKQFLKFTLATVCGIAIFLTVTAVFFIISIVGMAASSSSSTSVEDNSVFVIKLDGAIEERGGDIDPLSMALGDDTESTGLDDLLTCIRKAKDNDDIKGIYIEGGNASYYAPAMAQQLRDALKDFKKSGKWIVAYSSDYAQSSYYVASVADKVFLNKTGMIDFKGLGGKSEYYKGFFDKIGVNYQAIRVGKYKSAVERMTQTGMSDRDREQRMAYMKGIWSHWLKDIAESRKVTPEALNQLANDSIIMFADPNDYVKAKLVDKLMYPEEIKAEIKSMLKLDKDDDIPQLTLADMLNVKSKDDTDGDKIAVYYAYGEIVDNASFNAIADGHTIVGTEMSEDLRKLADDDDVKAIVVRVNSPGGSASASEQIAHAIELVKAKKPVVVSMGGYAASGGYMISALSNYIVAEPTTITGSIGIFGLIPNFSGLATDKLGVTFDGAQTNKYTDYLEKLVLSKENSDVISLMQTRINRGYVTFLDIVAKGRKMKRADVDSIAQGRVWLATDAQKIKLVDQLGSLDDAVKKAAALAKVKDYHTSSYPGKASWMEKLMPKKDKGTYLDGELRAVLGDFYEPFLEIRRSQERNCIQARLSEFCRID